jgi:hypothetical protein
MAGCWARPSRVGWLSGLLVSVTMVAAVSGLIGLLESNKGSHLPRSARYSEWMTVREMLAELQRLPRDAELLAFEAG